MDLMDEDPKDAKQLDVNQFEVELTNFLPHGSSTRFFNKPPPISIDADQLTSERKPKSVAFAASSIAVVAKEVNMVKNDVKVKDDVLEIVKEVTFVSLFCIK